MSSPPLLFAGQQSQTLQAETEILYVKKEKRAAEATAKLLAPILHPIKVQPWPGDWDYHAVIFVGEKTAKGSGRARQTWRRRANDKNII